MSVELCVFLRDDRLPTHDEWQRALDERGSMVSLDEFSPRSHTGFLPARLNGVECGFEYYYDLVEGNKPEEVASVIGDRSHFVSARLFGEENELQAATLALATLAHVSDGVFFDPQSGEMVAGDIVFEWITQMEKTEHDRRMAEAMRKWGNSTERVCTECSAPCPEYRKSCAVCGFEIGRA